MCVCTTVSPQIVTLFLQAEVLVHTNVHTFSGNKAGTFVSLGIAVFIYGFWCYIPLQHSHTIVVGMVPVMSSVQTR